MKNNHTHINIILDRTGSMEPIRDDIIGGFNAFLRKQRDTGGTASLSLIQFDSGNPYEIVHDFVPLQDVPELSKRTFVPRGTTPLWDAFGRGINDLESKLGKFSADELAEKVVFVVITDGAENSSVEFDKAKVEKMIADKQEKLGWEFVFLSTDIGAMNDVMSAGVAYSSSLMFSKNSGGTEQAWSSLSANIKDVREKKRKKIRFSYQDREDAL